MIKSEEKGNNETSSFMFSVNKNRRDRFIFKLSPQLYSSFIYFTIYLVRSTLCIFRLAALQKSGQLDWKKRISRIAPEKEVSPVINVNVSILVRKYFIFKFKCGGWGKKERNKNTKLVSHYNVLEFVSEN